ncbi:hypothetical protein Tco_1443378, partial [Tanacetum coccineum]
HIPSPPLPPPPSLHLPPPVPTSLLLPSSPLPPLPALLFIPPPIDRKEDVPETELPPYKRLCPTASISRYEVRESLTAAPRPSVGLSSAVHYELQAYRTHNQMQDYRITSQESLMTTLIAQVSSLQGQLSAALGQIQALQARDQTHTDDPKGAGSSA